MTKINSKIVNNESNKSNTSDLQNKKQASKITSQKPIFFFNNPFYRISEFKPFSNFNNGIRNLVGIKSLSQQIFQNYQSLNTTPEIIKASKPPVKVDKSNTEITKRAFISDTLANNPSIKSTLANKVTTFRETNPDFRHFDLASQELIFNNCFTIIKALVLKYPYYVNGKSKKGNLLYQQYLKYLGFDELKEQILEEDFKGIGRAIIYIEDNRVKLSPCYLDGSERIIVELDENDYRVSIRAIIKNKELQTIKILNKDEFYYLRAGSSYKGYSTLYRLIKLIDLKFRIIETQQNIASRDQEKKQIWSPDYVNLPNVDLQSSINGEAYPYPAYMIEGWNNIQPQFEEAVNSKGKAIISPYPIKTTPVTMTNAEMRIIEQLEWIDKQIYIGCGLNGALLNPEDANRASAEQARDNISETTVKYWKDRFADIAMWCLSRLDNYDKYKYPVIFVNEETDETLRQKYQSMQTISQILPVLENLGLKVKKQSVANIIQPFGLELEDSIFENNPLDIQNNVDSKKLGMTTNNNIQDSPINTEVQKNNIDKSSTFEKDVDILTDEELEKESIYLKNIIENGNNLIDKIKNNSNFDIDNIDIDNLNLSNLNLSNSRIIINYRVQNNVQNYKFYKELKKQQTIAKLEKLIREAKDKLVKVSQNQQKKKFTGRPVGRPIGAKNKREIEIEKAINTYLAGSSYRKTNENENIINKQITLNTNPENTKKSDYQYGCVMLNFEDNKPLKMLQDELIRQNITVNTQDNQGIKNGITTDLHCTLLYGLLDTVTKQDVINKLQEKPLYLSKSIIINKYTLFEKDDYDVLVAEPSSDSVMDLIEWNKQLTKLPYKTDYPDYKPHITIAYLKKDFKGKDKFIELTNSLKEIELYSSELVFNSKDFDYEIIKDFKKEKQHNEKSRFLKSELLESGARTFWRNDWVEWNTSGGKSQGKIIKIVDNGDVNIPNSKIKLKASKDDKVAIIQIYKNQQLSDVKVAHKTKSLKRVELDEIESRSRFFSYDYEKLDDFDSDYSNEDKVLFSNLRLNTDSNNKDFLSLRDKVFKKYKDNINMSYQELLKWSQNPCSRLASLDRSPINRNLELLFTKKEDWTQRHIEMANKTIGFNSRMKNGKNGKSVKTKQGKICPSKRDISLKNWAFDPS